MRLKVLLTSIFVVIICSSCGSVSLHAGVSYTDCNDEIDSSLRNSIHALNEKVVEGLQNNDLPTLLEIFVGEITEDKYLMAEAKTNISLLSGMMKDKHFTVFGDYYWEWDGTGRGPCVIFPESEDFSLTVESLSDKVFISLLETPDEFQNLMLGLIYMKMDGEWKLYSCKLGSFEVAKKNAVEWYVEAKEQYDEGYITPAALRLSIISSSLRPVPFLQYDKEDEILDFVDDVQTELLAQYEFPIEISSMASKPVIYYIEPQFVQLDMLTKIKYVTTYSLDEHSSLESEANEMTPIISDMFPGITHGADYLVFSAFSEPPTDPKKMYSSYGTVVELESSEG